MWRKGAGGRQWVRRGALASRMPEAAFAQEVRYLHRCAPVQRECVQAAKGDVIAFAGQVRRGQRDGMIP